ncbi:MAG TPA: NUDIX domain-containing protein [Terriglobales bacterium]|nr:NUDIX domain-containing protein [Terriglobales bacterium]
MPREISAGGVVVRKAELGWEAAVIEPTREGGTSNSAKRKSGKQGRVLALPKGIVDPGEEAAQTAVREVFEETGINARIITKLTDIKYVYVRSWGDKQRVFKIVSFFLLRYESGVIDDVTREMRIEVKQALWIPLEGAEMRLSYRGERDVIRKAQEWVNVHSQEMK